MKNDELYYSRLIAYLLALVAGITEIYCVMLKGNVLGTAVTAHTVRLFYAIFSKNYGEIIEHLLPIIGLIIGIYLFIVISKINVKKTYWKTIVLLIEIIAFIIVSLIDNGNNYNLEIFLITLVTTMQVETFKYMGRASYVSTLFTGNLRSLFKALFSKNFIDFISYLILFLGLVSGIFIGYIFINILGIKAINISILFLIIVIFIINKIDIDKCNI